MDKSSETAKKIYVMSTIDDFFCERMML